jgi:diguanylate cyclase (GGDEF)-like protein
MRIVRFVLVLGCAAALAAVCAAALARETGYPVISIIRQETHGGGSQTFDVATDAHGRLIFGNLEGVLVHDGAWWSRVGVPGHSVFRVLPLDHDRIAVALLDDFGVIAPDAKGLLAYRSLSPLLPPELRRNVEQVGMCPAPGGAVFVTDDAAVRWDGRSLRVLTRFAKPEAWRRCFSDGERIWTSRPDGLQEIGGPLRFAGRRVDEMVGDLVVVRNEGLFHLDETPYTTDGAAWLRGKPVMQGRRLRDGRIAIATLRYGLLIVKSDGTIDQIIDNKTGLPEEHLYAIAEDPEGALWLALDSSIARVDVSMRFSVVDARLGLRGSIHDVARHNGALVVATTEGVFACDATPAGLKAGPIEGVQFPWSLLSTHGELLIGSFGGLYAMRGASKPALIAGTTEVLVYVMSEARGDPSLVWLGADEGLLKLRRVGTEWKYEGAVPGSIRYIRTLVQDSDGIVWAASETEGAMRFDPRGGTITRFGSGDTQVLRVAGRVLFLPAGQPFSQFRDGKLVADPLLGHIRGGDPFSYSGTDRAGNIWVGERPPLLLRRLADGRYEREPHAIGTLEGDMEVFYAEPDGVMWLGSERGLYRVEPSSPGDATKPLAPRIHRVVAGNDRVLVDGNGTVRGGSTLPHDFGRLRIEVAPLSYRAATNYQYRLDPIDREWTTWSKQAFLDFTNLAPNDYTFRVRTRGSAGVVSKEATWTFTILPPWYATWWAIAIWAVLAAAIVAAIVRLRTRALRRRAEELQTLVGQQTERLEKLSFADPLTGVANRRYFDRVLADAWQTGQRLSLVLLDLDHFKEINDSQGHIAGDECLRRVAEQLEGDVVCRWGGEEFAILLRDTDEATAVAAAEANRTRIATLGLTASFGVATRVDGEEPQALIERADRVLYAAKRNGRNRVETVWTARSAGGITG